MSIAKYFDDMSYGPCPESDAEARSWLARGAAVDAVWAFGTEAQSEAVEGLSAGNMKRSFVDHDCLTD